MNYRDEKDLSNYKKIKTDTWDSIKDNIKLRAINSKCVDKYGKNIAYKRFLDISLVLSLQENQDRVLSYILTTDDLKKYNTTFNEAFEIAKNNSLFDKKRRMLPLREYMLQSEILYPLINIPCDAKVTNNKGAGTLEDIDSKTGIENIIVLCNKTDTFGATYMCLPEVLNEVYERFEYENFYILPMSIHHAWCIKKSYARRDNKKTMQCIEDDLLSMLEEFNDTQNKNQDILSYKIYYYSGDDGKCVFQIR